MQRIISFLGESLLITKRQVSERSSLAHLVVSMKFSVVSALIFPCDENLGRTKLHTSVAHGVVSTVLSGVRQAYHSHLMQWRRSVRMIIQQRCHGCVQGLRKNCMYYGSSLCALNHHFQWQMNTRFREPDSLSEYPGLYWRCVFLCASTYIMPWCFAAVIHGCITSCVSCVAMDGVQCSVNLFVPTILVRARARPAFSSSRCTVLSGYYGPG